MGGPLAGFRILELTSTVSGPMAGMILADQGADIIKIEPPLIGDLGRVMGSSRNGMAAMYSTLNRNKRSLVLDLKHAEDMAIFLKLIPDTDVVIENYRPGIVQKLGIDYETLKGINPGLVYVSITGYGESGPYQNRRVYDPLIQATTGTSAEQGDHGPNNVRTVIFDKVTGYTAAQAATAALLQRSKTGRGQYLPISMLKSALYYQWPDVMWSRTLQGEGISHFGELAEYFRVFKARDGFLAIVLVADDAFAHLNEFSGSELHLDPRFTTFVARLQNGAALQTELDQALAAFDVDDICRHLDQHGVPVARANTLDEVFDDPQVIEQDAILSVEHPVAGAMRIANTPFQFEGQDELPKMHAAILGQHSAEILRELGVAESEIERIEKREAANRELMAGFSLDQSK
jgi:crotonobetainyl-CoA:carnitine CoA-transferase CaiB-like acyl-CoA transferase